MGRPRSCECNSCKKCERRERERARYQALSLEERRELIAKRDPEKVKAADRARYYRNREERQARMRDWYENHKEETQEHNRRWRARNPEKRLAHSRVAHAIESGRLVRQPCEKCGDPKSHAHHFDYSKPLDVVWLCSAHHGEVHRQYPSTVAVEKRAA